ncbi:hypothetical protein G7085_03755 [Tessaracoccus sp. HDW20]|uniref:hypothetical protein n=1 Tax=Tessaracoccus coleopterorum TaxID=2714950 RepID=UPI0018D37BA9|nr:hypothetical protein [Tessaracoccus coleopterorum]NHB84061.1 hypothetical protein [Tessaracoccus coleopterorum]
MWTALYLGNWHFMGADSYFNSDGVPSSLLHMWSLAVEEQFYLVWPLLLGGVAWVAGRRFAGGWGSGGCSAPWWSPASSSRSACL